MLHNNVTQYTEERGIPPDATKSGVSVLLQ